MLLVMQVIAEQQGDPPRGTGKDQFVAADEFSAALTPACRLRGAAGSACRG